MFKLARQLRQGAPRRKTTMRSFEDGLGRLPKKIAEELGGALSMHHHVNTIEPASEGFRVHVETPAGAQEILARHIVLAVPHNVAARILRELPGADGLAAELRAIGQAPVAVVHIGVHTSNISEPINGFGHLVVRGGSIRTLGSIYSSSVFPGRTPSDDMALFTNFTGGTLDPHALDLSDEELTSFVTKDLESAIGLRGDPVFTHVARWPEAFPQYHVGHFARCERIRRHAGAIPGLSLIGNYLDGLSINDCIRSATRAATRLIDTAPA
jgi:oxygen-dependent protoporphyrinogen oxidase